MEKNNAEMETVSERGGCCTRRSGSKERSFTSLLGAVAIALLPKCPFCLLAYSSAVTMCSGATYDSHAPGWVSFISISLALVVLYTVCRTYRGARTLFAAALAMLGTGIVAYSELVSGSLGLYQCGALMMLAAALLNGGVYVTVRRLLVRARRFIMLKYRPGSTFEPFRR